ncbi:PTS mannose transporter subunit IIA, partial [Salmonella enterica subsp. diarizonae]|nr:PTS mannose transporter subunit IIA [Salmonella enterica subsp. diarizonae]
GATSVQNMRTELAAALVVDNSDNESGL